MMKRLIIFGIIVLFLINGVYATNYYVSSSLGNDSYNGISELTPWRTISKVNSITFSHGDNILFKRGDIWGEQLLIRSIGTANSYIKYSVYGAGNEAIITGNLTSKGIIFSGDYNLVSNLTIKGAGSSGIKIYDGANFNIVQYCSIHEKNWNGIEVEGDYNFIK